ncbi:MAG TPA: hypothetical protein EYQ26_00910 [Rhodospirillales bacterium]|jgi:hypothetical protein|nr:hypothetical protein [Rhodospirillales bacterium]
MKMNTPTAIFLGLPLIAGAIFYRQPSIPEAQAGIMDSSSKYIGWKLAHNSNNSHVIDVEKDTAYWCDIHACVKVFNFRK